MTSVNRAVLPGTVQIWSDIACPWATMFVERLWQTRVRLALELDVRFDHHVFSLERANHCPIPQEMIDDEAQGMTVLEPSLGWQPWRPEPAAPWPSSSLVAMSAVQAAKLADVGGIAAGERLDLLLRRALFNESRPIDDRDEILAIARSVDGLDLAALAAAMDDGRGADAAEADLALVGPLGIEASPHVLLADGTSIVNPGIRMPESDSGYVEQDSSVLEEILTLALSPQG